MRDFGSKPPPPTQKMYTVKVATLLVENRQRFWVVLGRPGDRGEGSHCHSEEHPLQRQGPADSGRRRQDAMQGGWRGYCEGGRRRHWRPDQGGRVGQSNTRPFVRGGRGRWSLTLGWGRYSRGELYVKSLGSDLSEAVDCGSREAKTSTRKWSGKVPAGRGGGLRRGSHHQEKDGSDVGGLLMEDKGIVVRKSANVEIIRSTTQRGRWRQRRSKGEEDWPLLTRKRT
jgi:hypothetical protein